MKKIKWMPTLKTRLDNIKYTISILYQSSPRYFLQYWLVSVFMAFFPFITLYLWRMLLNLLMKEYQDFNSAAMSVMTIAVAYCVIMVVEKWMVAFEKIVSFKYNDEIDYCIDNMLIKATAKTDLSFFDSSHLRDELKRVASTMGGVTKDVPRFLFETFQMAVWNIVSLIVLGQVTPLFPIIVVLLAVPAIIGNRKVGRRDYEFRKRYTVYERRIGYYQGLFQGDSLFEMKLYDLKDYFTTLYTDAWEVLHAAKCRNALLDFLTDCMSAVLSAAGDVAVYAVSIARLAANKLGVGDIAYYVAVLSEFRWRFIGLFDDMNTLFQLSDQVSDMRGFLEREGIAERCGILEPGKRPIIEFRNVSFRYPSSDTYVLRDCSFTIHPSEMLGLVGLNGAGKSTIVKLLCRFYDPTAGQILVDGIDAREYDVDKLRAMYGVLFQDYMKYSLSLRQNVALSDMARADEDLKILDACKESKVSDFICGWKNGIDENMTKRFDPEGKELSGGQWQRVALARAIFRDAPVILLDEPSAALDAVAEQEIFDAFSKLYKDKSALMISHRLSNITLCDRILVLENGHVIEQGTHEELLKLGGRYAHMFHLQASKYL